jgi:lysozyme
MKGIDVSSNNGNVDFQAVKNSGVSVVYIKATEGITYTDPNLTDNYNKSKAAGLNVGFYHFLRANNPIDEAKHFLNAVQGLQVNCLYMIDVEIALGQTVAKISSNVRQFADYLISQGKQVGIYAGDAFYNEELNAAVKNLPLWVADYDGTPNESYDGLQYSENGKVAGINGNVDLDTFDNNILIVQPIEPKTPVLKQQIEALQYWLNVDYSAKITADGLIREEELYSNLEAVGKLIVKGHKSHVVEWIQERLVGYGYLKVPYTDMVYDESTFQAITNMQKNWGLATDGIIGLKTWTIFLNN